MKSLLLLVFTVAALLLVGCSNNQNSDMAGAPSGDNCAENVAYLQDGVDKYKEAVGEYPADVQELLDTVDGKGPFVVEVPECPSGNVYVIDNGIVREAPPTQ